MPNNPSPLSSSKISGIMIPDISKRTVFFTDVIQAIQKSDNTSEYYTFLKRIDTIGKYQSADYPTKLEWNLQLRSKIGLRVAEIILSSELYDATKNGDVHSTVELLFGMNLQQLKDSYARSREKLVKIRAWLESKFIANIAELTKAISLPEIFKDHVEYAGIFSPLFRDSGSFVKSSSSDYVLFHDILDKIKSFGNKQVSLFPLSIDNYPPQSEKYPSIEKETTYLRDSIEHYQAVTKISASGLLLIKYWVPEDFYEEIMQKFSIRWNVPGVFRTIESYEQKFKLDIVPLVFRYYIIRFIDQKYKLGIKEGCVFPSKDHLIEIADWIFIFTNQEKEDMIAEFMKALRDTEITKNSEYKAIEDFFHDWVVSQFQNEIKRIADFSTLPIHNKFWVTDIKSSEYIEWISQEVKKLDRLISVDDHNKYLSQLQQSYVTEMVPLLEEFSNIFSRLSTQDAESQFYDIIKKEMTSRTAGTYYEVYGSIFSIMKIAAILTSIHTNINKERFCRNLMHFISDQQSIAANRRFNNLLYILWFDLIGWDITPNNNIDISLLPGDITHILRDLCMNLKDKSIYLWYVDYENRIADNIQKEWKRDDGLRYRISKFINNEINSH